MVQTDILFILAKLTNLGEQNSIIYFFKYPVVTRSRTFSTLFNQLGNFQEGGVGLGTFGFKPSEFLGLTHN